MATDRIPSGHDAHDEDEVFAAPVIGTGSLHSVREVDEADEEPGIWIPMHRSGSRLGGWQRVAVQRRRHLGFRRP